MGDARPEWGDAVLIYFIWGDGEDKRLGTPEIVFCQFRIACS
jgi:hypothetical protein